MNIYIAEKCNYIIEKTQNSLIFRKNKETIWKST